MNNYQRAREMAGFTQKELAAKIGVKPGIISRYEAESDLAVIPPLPRIKAIAEACGVSVNFLTDPDYPLGELDDEQRRRFKQEIRLKDHILQKWKDETEASYGTAHPFLYMLKDRWIPTIFDVDYVCKKFGMERLLILNTELPAESDLNERIQSRWNSASNKISPDENGIFTLKIPDFQFVQIETFLYNKGYIVNETEAKLFEESGIKVIDESGSKHLYMNVDNVAPDVLKALIVLINSSKMPPQGPEGPETADSNIQK